MSFTTVIGKFYILFQEPSVFYNQIIGTRFLACKLLSIYTVIQITFWQGRENTDVCQGFPSPLLGYLTF